MAMDEHVAELLEAPGRTLTITARSLLVTSERSGEVEHDTYPHDGTQDGIARAVERAWAGEPSEESRGRLARDAARVRATRTASRY